MKTEKRVNVRISERAHKELRKRMKRTDGTIISIINSLLGV